MIHAKRKTNFNVLTATGGFYLFIALFHSMFRTFLPLFFVSSVMQDFLLHNSNTNLNYTFMTKKLTKFQNFKSC